MESDALLAPIAFVDCETTGLDPDRHGIWEVALIRGRAERVWQLPVDLAQADPRAAEINGMHERYDLSSLTPRVDFVREFLKALSPGPGAGRVHLAGAVVSFDEERLRRLCRRFVAGDLPWHYHLIDVEALAAGYVAGMDLTKRIALGVDLAIAAPPWDSEELSRAVGVEPDRFDRHTALGDARWAKAVYEAVIDPTTKETHA